MKKADVIEKLRRLPYDPREYWVVAGGAMVMYGIREETHDVDLGCTRELADRLEAEGFLCGKTDGGKRRFSIGGYIEVFEDWLYDRVDQVDGVPVISLPGLVEMKRRLGREKDERDLALIRAHGKDMNEYLEKLGKIEFTVTLACTGRCKHCQNGDPVQTAEHIDAETAAAAVRRVCGLYDIKTVMTFGGEPLLYPETVCAIHRAAYDMGVAKRQVITNGFFSISPERIAEVALMLKESGVNDLRLSVDAFHQETIPLEPVLRFAECAVKAGIPVRLSPAWLVSREDGNPYNIRTREIIRAFAPLGIETGEGNVIFPSGNALKYLREYFDGDAAGSSPYEEDPADVRTLSFSANGDVLNGNAYRTEILELIRDYRP